MSGPDNHSLHPFRNSNLHVSCLYYHLLQDLLLGMLTVQQGDRITAAQALAHPWMKASVSELASHDLGAALAELRLFNIRRKLREAASRKVSSNERNMPEAK